MKDFEGTMLQNPQQVTYQFGEKVDLALAITLSCVLVGTTFFCGFSLTKIVNPGDNYSLSGNIWGLTVLFSSFLSLSCCLAVVGRAIGAIDPSNSELWNRFSSTMFMFSLWVLLYWVGIWAPPFVIGMYVFFKVREVIGIVIAIISTSLTIFMAVLILTKILPKAILQQAFRADIITNLGWKLGFPLFFMFLIIGGLYLNSCFRFEVNSDRSIYTRFDTLNLTVNLSGRILNHDRLRGTVVAVDPPHSLSRKLTFLESEKGKYDSWLPLTDFPVGNYRVEIFFENFYSAKMIKKLTLSIYTNNQKKRKLLFRIAERKPT